MSEPARRAACGISPLGMPPGRAEESGGLCRRVRRGTVSTACQRSGTGDPAATAPPVVFPARIDQAVT